MIWRLRAYAGRRVAAKAMNSGFHALSVMGRLHPDARPERHGVRRIADIPYRPASTRPEHRLDLYVPDRGRGPWPVVFYVHGGGFQALSKDTHWLMGLAFARRGYLVVNVSYRLAPRHRFPAPLDDVCAAYAFAGRHLARWGGDPGRIAFAGESAGANLVTALTLACCYRRPERWARPAWDTARTHPPRAVLPSCGMHQVSDAARFARRRPDLPGWIGRLLVDVERCYLPTSARNGHSGGPSLDLANPLLVLERGEAPDRPLPPFHINVGTADPLLDDTRRLAAALDAQGVPCEAAYFEGQPHAFHAMVFQPAARRCWREMHAFLGRHL